MMNPAWITFTFRSTHFENKNFNIFAWKKGPTKATNPEVHEHYGVVLLAQLLLPQNHLAASPAILRPC